MIDIDTPVYFTAPDGARYRVTISYDTDTDSPRTWSNVCTMHTFDARWNSPDGKVCDDPRHRQIHPLIPAEYVESGWVDMRRATRWVNLFGRSADILAIAGLDRDPRDGTLDLDTSAGDEREGYVVITSDSWAECMGDEPFNVEAADSIMRSEVEVYNKWVRGEFTSFLVECEQEWQAIGAGGVLSDEDRTMTTWEFVNAVGGFDDEEYALSEAISSLPDGTVAEDE
jgi:hypothetical protein